VVIALDSTFLDRHPVARHVISRAGWYLLTFFVAVSINFALPRLGDSSPVDIMMARAGANLDAASAREQEETYLREFGLVQLGAHGEILRDVAGKPLPTSLAVQFGRYLLSTARGDLGTSILQYPRRVSEVIGAALPWTLALQLPTIVLGWLLGNALGAVAAYYRGVLDRVVYPLALLASAIPAFCLGILLVYVFGIQLEWLPSVGGYDDGMVPNLSLSFLRSASYYFVLPFISIFVIIVGHQAIGMRSMCIYELGSDYVKYAKLLGVRERTIVRYMFRNAMLPQLTGLALALGGMVGGALIAEMIFSYPGLGMAILTAIRGNDYPLITGCTLLVTVCVLCANFCVDLLIGILDPRVRAGASRH
jgi:peptide/nickel transport system permease protein